MNIIAPLAFQRICKENPAPPGFFFELVYDDNNIIEVQLMKMRRFIAVAKTVDYIAIKNDVNQQANIAFAMQKLIEDNETK